MTQDSIILTADGSHSVLDSEKNEQYHSLNGALTESLHVFIQAGFRFLLPGIDTIKILEVGFGTGLNALLTFVHAKQHDISVGYTAFEPYPLDEGIIRRLNYPSLLQFDTASEIFLRLHDAPYNTACAISADFVLHKRAEKFELCMLPADLFDLIYFDAFSPGIQPELWTLEVFNKIAAVARPGAVLVTYCCKGEVKRNLRTAGFDVKKLPGPPGKREMLRAIRR